MQKNVTAHQPDVFLTGVHWLLATDNGRSAFARANNCQGHLHTPQAGSVRTSCHKGMYGW